MIPLYDIPSSGKCLHRTPPHSNTNTHVYKFITHICPLTHLALLALRMAVPVKISNPFGLVQALYSLSPSVALISQNFPTNLALYQTHCFLPVT